MQHLENEIHRCNLSIVDKQKPDMKKRICISAKKNIHVKSVQGPNCMGKSAKFALFLKRMAELIFCYRKTSYSESDLSRALCENIGIIY